MDGEAAFFARIRGDTELQALTGVDSAGDARVVPGWPPDTLGEDDYPRVTFFMPNANQRPTLGVITIQADTWVWPGQGAGPKKAAIDARLLELLNEKAWTYDDGSRVWRIWSVEAGGGDYPAPPDRPLRRRRNFRLTMS